MTGDSAIGRAAEDLSFINHLAALIVEQRETDHILSEWHRWASVVRGRSVAEAGEPHAELVSLLVAIILESHRLASAGVVDAAEALIEGLRTHGANERMGNFEIQRLMSQHNTAVTLTSNVERKLGCVVAGMIQKIG